MKMPSKQLKKNLLKWIFMYVSVIALFTSVVTYSKYISSFKQEEQARAAKFIFKINPIANSCSDNDEVTSLCTVSQKRPTSLNYSFEIDTSLMEVNATYHFSLYINNAFAPFSNDFLTDEGKNVIETNKGSSNVKIGSSIYTIYTLQEQIEANLNSQNKKTYNVHLKYNGGINGYKALSENQTYQVLVVGYSVVQKKI